MRKIYAPTVSDDDGTLPINLGGFQARTFKKAAENIGLVTRSMNGKPNGVILIGSDGLLTRKSMPAEVSDPSVPNLVGTFNVGAGMTTILTITNYDSFTFYAVSASSGLAVRRADAIHYTAGLIAGVVELTINDRVFEITVDVPIPARPYIQAPNDHSTLVNNVVTLEGTAFQINNDADTHWTSDWEIATDPAFTNIVASIYSTSSHLTSWDAGAMDEYTTYYARVRYTGAQHGESDWSPVSTFTTGANGQLNEWGKLVAPDGVANDHFGVSVALNADATLALIGAWPNITGPSSGAVYFFTREGSTWTYQQKITPGDSTTGFGGATALNADATIALIGAHGDNTQGTVAGCVYVFTRIGSVWTQQQKLYAADAAAGDGFGTGVALNADATLALIGSWNDDDGGSNRGSVYVFTRVGSVWTQQQKLHASDAADSDSFGRSVALNADATFAVIGAFYEDDRGTDAGAAYVFTRVGSVWTQQQKLTASDGVSGDRFGVGVAIMTNSATIFVSASGANDLGDNSGAVYVFTGDGSTWTQQQKILASDGVAGDIFGSSVAVTPDGMRAMIGSYNDNGVATGSGSAYFYQ